MKLYLLQREEVPYSQSSPNPVPPRVGHPDISSHLGLEGGTKTRSWSGVVIALVPFTTIVVSVLSTRFSNPTANVRLATSIAIPSALAAVALSLLGTTLVRAFAIAIASGGAFAATTAVSTMVFARLPFDSSTAVEFANYQASASIGQAFGAVGIGVLAELRSTRFAGSTAVILLVCLLIILRTTTQSNASS